MFIHKMEKCANKTPISTTASEEDKHTEGKSLLIYSKGYLIKNKNSSAMFLLRRCSNTPSLFITQHEIEKNAMPLRSLLLTLCPLCFHVQETAVHSKVK